MQIRGLDDTMRNTEYTVSRDDMNYMRELNTNSTSMLVAAILFSSNKEQISTLDIVKEITETIDSGMDIVIARGSETIEDFKSLENYIRLALMSITEYKFIPLTSTNNERATSYHFHLPSSKNHIINCIEGADEYRIIKITPDELVRKLDFNSVCVNELFGDEASLRVYPQYIDKVVELGLNNFGE